MKEPRTDQARQTTIFQNVTPIEKMISKGVIEKKKKKEEARPYNPP